MVQQDALADEELVDRHLAGDSEAFEAILTRYQRQIYNLAYRMVANPSDAADLTQEIFLQLLRKAASFRGEAAFSTWFYRLATNCCYDFLRRSRDRADREMPADPLEKSFANGNADPSDLTESRELAVEIEKAMLALPPDQRVVVILRDIQGYDYLEIAEMTGLPLGTVKSRLSRARLFLCRALAPLREQREAAEHLMDGGKTR